MSILPSWTVSLRTRLAQMAEELTRSLHGWQGSDLVITPEQCGYTGELATSFIQKAIDTAAVKGGGTVLLSRGDYVSGTLVLRSGIRLEVADGSRLLGSPHLTDYPEHIARRRTVQDTNMGMHQSLIFAEGCENVSICGHGEINGQGHHFPGEETAHGTPGRPFLMRFLDCSNVHIKDITLKDAACWMQNYLHCENLLMEDIHVENQANYNNDGIDIDGCRNVIVRRCEVSSGDDALCFKGASQMNGENILVEDSLFLSSCNAIKFGTDSQGDFRNVLIRNCTVGGVSEEMRRIKHADSDSAFSWEAVDGGNVENIWVHHIHIVRAMSPFFLRLEKRGRVKPEDPVPPLSTMRHILFEDIDGEENGPRGSYFIGIPEKAIEEIALKNIHLHQRTSLKPVLSETDIPEMYGVYPDAHMIDDMGDAPAYGLWARHVHGLYLDHYEVLPTGSDLRPALVVETDVQ